jgi:hypothetical protein
MGRGFVRLTMAAIAALWLLSSEVSASGGVMCSVADKGLQFHWYGSVSRSMELRYLPGGGSLVIDVAGTDARFAGMDLAGTGVAKPGLADRIVHSWITQDEIRFHLLFDLPQEVNGTANLVLVTRNTGQRDGDSLMFEGTYELLVLYADPEKKAAYRELKSSGAAECSMD